MFLNSIPTAWYPNGHVVIRDEEEQIFDFKEFTLSRIKKNNINHYPVISKIASGSFREVYEIHSSSGKFKAMKISFSDEAHSKKEFQILKLLNDSGRQTGISKPSKAYFELPNGINIQVMPKYHQSLHNYLLGGIGEDEDATKYLQNTHFPEQLVIQMLKQLVSGLMYLKERSVYHGDVSLSNVLCLWAVPIRFDLIDFERSLDLSSVPTLEQLFLQLDENSQYFCNRIMLTHPNLPEPALLQLCKKWFHSQDALDLVICLEKYFIHLIKDETNLNILKEIIADIRSNSSIDGVFDKLKDMWDSSEPVSTESYYAKSKYAR